MTGLDEARALFFEARDLIRAGELSAAETTLRRALLHAPDRVSVLTKLAGVLLQLGQFDEAAGLAERVTAVDPAHAEAWLVLARVRQQQRRIDEALAAFDRLVAAAPDDAEAWVLRGMQLKEVHQLADAAASFLRAVTLAPGDTIPDLAGEALFARLSVGDWTDFAGSLASIEQGLRERHRVCRPLPLVSFVDDPALQRIAGELLIDAEATYRPPRSRSGPYRHSRIRLAYLSPDFRYHPVSFLTAGVFEHHDRQRFETIAISLGDDEGAAMRRRIEAAFETFHDARGMTDAALEDWIRNAEIDILVDLAGHTWGNRLNVLAGEPAPVQVNYLGYPATTGAPYIHYIVADSFVIPPGMEQHYSEKIVRLPDTFQANDGLRLLPTAAPRRASVGLPDDGFVFCSFNHTYKIHPEFFDVWMRLVARLPGSVLWLLGSEAATRAALVQAAGQRGVQRDRLVFADRVLYGEHLARFGLADLLLDTLPFNAGTTASDALWAGVPVVTCAGKSFAGRMAGSLLRAVGLPDLVTENLAEYEALALRLASNPEQLAEVRARLARNRKTAPLFDTARFTRNLEAAYALMWARAEQGLPPASFDVPAS